MMAPSSHYAKLRHAAGGGTLCIPGMEEEGVWNPYTRVYAFKSQLPWYKVTLT
jgi:hypothetical protein